MSPFWMRIVSPGQAHQPLDVVRRRRAGIFEDDHVPPLWSSEIVRQLAHQYAVAIVGRILRSIDAV